MKLAWISTFPIGSAKSAARLMRGRAIFFFLVQIISPGFRHAEKPQVGRLLERAQLFPREAGIDVRQHPLQPGAGKAFGFDAADEPVKLRFFFGRFVDQVFNAFRDFRKPAEVFGLLAQDAVAEQGVEPFPAAECSVFRMERSEYPEGRRRQKCGHFFDRSFFKKSFADAGSAGNR